MSTTMWLLLSLIAGLSGTTWATPLDDYVNMPDSHYKYELLSEHRMEGEYTAYIINMTSQQWLTGRLH